MEFTGTTYKAAIAEAMKHFAVTTEALDVKVLAQGSNSFFSKKPWRIEAAPVNVISEAAAPPAAQAALSGIAAEESAAVSGYHAMNDMRFFVKYTPEGVMLEAGRSADPQEIMNYVEKRGIRDADVKAALAAIRAGTHPAILAPSTEEEPPLLTIGTVRI